MLSGGRVVEELEVRWGLRWALRTAGWQGGRRKVSGGESFEEVVAVRVAQVSLLRIVVDKVEVVEWRGEKVVEGLGGGIGRGLGEEGQMARLLTGGLARVGCCCC